MKIATWNVNSIRARLERFLAWLGRTCPDVVCLQELKVVDEAFPFDELRSAGYHAAVHGQKTYNGVAILSRTEPEDVHRGLDDGADDPQARLISAEIAGVQVISVYVPSGQKIGTEKFAYKLEWLRRLLEYLERRFKPSELIALCGDLNVAPDDKDFANPDEWADSVLCCPPVREAIEAIRRWGFEDVFRKHHPEGGVYSWWDYRRLAFPRNDGLRLDHVFATAPLAERCTAASVDRDERKGAKPSDHAQGKPSDHAPVIATFES